MATVINQSGSSGARPAGPRRTVFQIEREQRWRIWLLFASLLGIHLAAAWVMTVIVAFSFYLSFPVYDTVGWVFRPRWIAVILGVAVVLSLVQWFSSQMGGRGRLMRAMHCTPLDPGDRFHRRLANIVEEMRIATGAPKVECVTVKTVGMNAFAFSDLRGGAVIGVTEGALARLSRQQLQAVVAHEFGHVLSGSYVTATVSCLLFGVHSELGDRLEDAAIAGGTTRAAPVILSAVLLRGFLWVLQLGSSVTNAALSRERERQADVAAARYTRDPLSLAEALRMIGRHPGGAGFIPPGLAPLCIRDTEARLPGLVGSWQSTHPPISERVAALLALAAVSPAEFERQAEQAGERHDERQHWAPPPQAGGAGATGMTCPSCAGGLQRADYEGIHVVVCPACGGRLASTDQVQRILARREVGFTDEQRHLADLVAASGDQLRRVAVVAKGHAGAGLIPCPSCAKTMMRRHYSYEYAVEVDQCFICDLLWFEKDELEVLQLLVERRADGTA